jgi:CO/xanthine dehydrogenase Mo-binding subunit
MRDTLSSDIGSHPSVVASHVRRSINFGADAPLHSQPPHFTGGRTDSGEERKIEAVYSTPFLAHATMEPMNCTVKVSADRAECWVPSQNAEASLAALSEQSGVPLAKCEVYRHDLGGGFGRRGGNQDYVRQAVAIAKQFPDVPVKMIWSREEDMAHDFYRPISVSGEEGEGGRASDNRLSTYPVDSARARRPQGVVVGLVTRRTASPLVRMMEGSRNRADAGPPAGAANHKM